MALLNRPWRVDIRCYSTETYLRKLRRRKAAIYRPAFENLQKGSPEYQALAESGKVWENHFKPQKLKPYLAAQSRLKKKLQYVDELQDIVREREGSFNSTTRSLVAEYATQSNVIDGSDLPIWEALQVEKELDRQFFKNTDSLTSLEASDLAALRLPPADALHPSRSERVITEIRNHLVVSRYLFELGLANPHTSGISLSDIKSLSSVMLAGTTAETHHWVKQIKAGDFRNKGIRDESNPNRIFPSAFEVPACMERFIQWRDQMHNSQQLHPVILATHIYVYFVLIHPFQSGNGRMGRSLMADYLVRQRYLPVVFSNMDRTEYIRSISDAQDGKPRDLCTLVVETLGNMLSKFNLKEHI